MKLYLFLIWNIIIMFYVSSRLFLDILQRIENIYKPKVSSQNTKFIHEVPEELRVSEEVLNTIYNPSVEVEDNSNEETKDFKTNFVERIERMKNELSGDDVMTDIPGVSKTDTNVFEFDENDEYMPSVLDNETGAGVEIITDEYEKQLEDKLL